MNARLCTFPVAVLLAGCSALDPVLNAVPAGDTGPSGLPSAPEGRAGALTREDADGAAFLGDQISDARNTPEEPDGRTDGPGWDAFYDADAVHAVEIELSEESWDMLSEDGRTWAPAVVYVDGVEYPNAGVRRKGNTTWRSMSDKPSFKIKLEAFGPGPRLHGLEKLTLNNMVSDPSQARENLALRIWWALGATASRGSWATVTVNGERYGLY
ncbi:MAG: CotH kinase family protein, partial [Myxococcota bacterium]